MGDLGRKRKEKGELFSTILGENGVLAAFPVALKDLPIT